MHHRARKHEDNLDLQLRVTRTPGPGETIFGEDILIAGGGKAANVAYLAARLGAPARLLGHVGEDEFAQRSLAALRETDIDLRAVRSVRGALTGIAMIAVEPDGEKTIIAAPNANDLWTDDDHRMAEEAISTAADGSVLVLNLEIAPSAVTRALEMARARGHRIVFDPSPTGRFDPEFYRFGAYLTPNPGEAERLCGFAIRDAHDAIRAGRLLVDRGAKAGLVKLGEGGCAIVTAAATEQVPSRAVTPVDKTGAGDAFAGAVAVGLLEQRPLTDCVRLGVAAAAICVTRYGAQASYPTRANWTRFSTNSRSSRGTRCARSSRDRASRSSG